MPGLFNARRTIKGQKPAYFAAGGTRLKCLQTGGFRPSRGRNLLIINLCGLLHLPYLRTPIIFLTKKQGHNEQLRIDGDFYPCAF